MKTANEQRCKSSKNHQHQHYYAYENRNIQFEWRIISICMRIELEKTKYTKQLRYDVELIFAQMKP